MKTKDAVVSLTIMGGVLYLKAPYNPDANSCYKSLHGKWVPEQKLWKFTADQTSELLVLIERLFGVAIKLGETATATRGTEYLGKKPPGVKYMTPPKEVLPGGKTKGGLVPVTAEPSYESAISIATTLKDYMKDLTKSQKETIFLLLFDD